MLFVCYSLFFSSHKRACAECVSSYTSYDEQRAQAERLLQELSARDQSLNGALAEKVALQQQLEQMQEQVRGVWK